MRTTLNADGNIAIPDEIRRSDQLAAGDLFEVERLTPGHYLLTKQPGAASGFKVDMADDGLPIIRTENGVITTKMVRDLESQTP